MSPAHLQRIATAPAVNAGTVFALLDHSPEGRFIDPFTRAFGA
jgi:hypothetical protein